MTRLSTQLGWTRSLLLFAVLLSGCKVGPDYCQPCVPLADAWIDVQHPRLNGQPVDLAAWWSVYNDPVLERLIFRAHDQNLSLGEAGMRIEEARALRAIAQGNVWPQSQSLNGSYHRVAISQNTSGLGAIPGFSPFFDRWAGDVNLAWELDFWGRYKRAIEAADADLDASIEGYDEVLVLIVSETANAYIDLRMFDRRLKLARENAKLQQETLNITQVRRRGGLVSDLDVSQVETVLRETEALIPTLETAQRLANNRLCVLLGEPPHDLRPELGFLDHIPQPPQAVCLDVPADLLRRRPDVARAERQLAAQSARIGVAVSELYPHFSITGNIGVEARNLSQLFTSNSLAAAAGPSFRWNILNYGRIRQGVAAQDARFQQLAYAYQHNVLTANREAEDAIVNFLKAHDRVEKLSQAEQAAVRSADLVVIQEKGGLADYNRVVAIQQELVRRQDALAAAQGELARSLIGVFKSLGGGWEIRFNVEGPFSVSTLNEIAPQKAPLETNPFESEDNPPPTPPRPEPLPKP